MLRSAPTFALMLLLVLLCASCSGDSHDYSNADQFTLYSIDGNSYPPLEEPPADSPKFHRWPILGEADIAHADLRNELMDALAKGISESDGGMAKCFNPRHGLRIVENGQTTEYLICFECLQVQIYRGGEMDHELTSESPKDTFNRAVRNANMTLAPGG